MQIVLYILGILFGIILLICVFPVRYIFYWDRKDFESNHKVKFRIHDPLLILLYRGTLHDRKWQMRFTIFGMPVNPREKKPKEEAEEVIEKGVQQVKRRGSTFLKMRRRFTLQELVTLGRLIVRHLWRWLHPSSFAMDLQYGTGNPASTGIIFGYYSALPHLQKDSLQLHPEFVAKGFAGNIKIQGWIVLGSLIVRAILIATNAFYFVVRKKIRVILNR